MPAMKRPAATARVSKKQKAAASEVQQFNVSQLSGSSCNIAAPLSTSVRDLKAFVCGALGAASDTAMRLIIAEEILEPDDAPIAQWVSQSEGPIEVVAVIRSLIRITRHLYQQMAGRPRRYGGLRGYGRLVATDEINLEAGVALKSQLKTVVPSDGFRGPFDSDDDEDPPEILRLYRGSIGPRVIKPMKNMVGENRHSHSWTQMGISELEKLGLSSSFGCPVAGEKFEGDPSGSGSRAITLGLWSSEEDPVRSGYLDCPTGELADLDATAHELFSSGDMAVVVYKRFRGND